MRVLELFCGIGGCAAALEAFPDSRVVAALDIDQPALEAYRGNFAHPTETRNLVALGHGDFRRWRADLWWLSPPCQPFTGRGRGRDDEDPRSRALLALLDNLGAERPPFLALENVPGFRGSRCHARLLAVLEAAGYEVAEAILCPSDLGLPNRRRRFYLVASRDGGLVEPAGGPRSPTRRQPLSSFLDEVPGDGLLVEAELLRRYEGALSLVNESDPRAVTACFTSAYGRSPVRSGSYLVHDGSPQGGASAVRRFSPEEILRLLGFTRRFGLPEDFSLRRRWSLVGNSLSLPPTRESLARLPPLGGSAAQRLSGGRW